MARVKNQTEASAVTILSKTRRWQRLKILYNVRKLDELFPANSVPNDAGDDFLKCSGDVLRDLCLIGELLTRKGMSSEEMKNRVKNSFLPSVCVRHADVKELLERMKRGDVNAAKVKTEDHLGFGDKSSKEIDYGESDADEELEYTDDEETFDGTSSPLANHQVRSRCSETNRTASEHTPVEQCPQTHESTETILPQQQHSQGYFDNAKVEGHRRAKNRAIAGITETVEIEDKDEDDDEDVFEDSYGNNDILLGRAAAMQPTTLATPFPTTSNIRYLTSLRPMAEDGFADAYGAAALQGPPPKPPTKRKSAPGDLERREVKRARSSSSVSLPASPPDTSEPPQNPSYMQSKHATLVSCLKMTYTLVDGIGRSLCHNDLSAVENKAHATKMMVEQVLAFYGHSDGES